MGIGYNFILIQGVIPDLTDQPVGNMAPTDGNGGACVSQAGA